MYGLLFYDVQQSRRGKWHRILGRTLFRVQKSVFEGDLSPEVWEDLSRERARLLDPGRDTVLLFRTSFAEAWKIGWIGVDTSARENLRRC